MRLTTVEAILITSLISALITFRSGHCKTINLNQHQKPTVSIKSKGLENFVDFTADGDQLAVENKETKKIESSRNRAKDVRQILGKNDDSSRQKQNREEKEVGRGCPNTLICPNVQKAIHPIIPIGIGALVMMFGAIGISWSFRYYFLLKKKFEQAQHEEPDTDSGYGYGSSDHTSDDSEYRLFGYDLKNINYTRLLKNVLTAIDKVY